MRRERLVPAAVAGLLALGTLPLLRGLLVPDLNWCYGYLTFDSYDWIQNALYWAGERLVPSFRPPGVPLVMALLDRLGALALLPVVNYAILGGIAVLLYGFLKQRHGATIAVLATVIFYTNHFSQDVTRYVGAEPACTLAIVLATRLFLGAAARPTLYLPFGLALGLGFLVHYATLPAGVGFAVAVLLTRREHLRHWALWGGLAVAAAPPAAWLAFRAWRYRHLPPGFTTIHIIEPLLKLAPDNLVFYSFALPAVLGRVLLPLYAAGAWKLVRGGIAADPFRVAVLAPLLGEAAFWGFCYDWVDRRFLFYAFPLLIALLAEGLSALAAFARRGPWARFVAAAWVIVALLWNQIRYPTQAIRDLALTPMDFLEIPGEGRPGSGQLVVHYGQAKVVRLNASLLDGLRGGLLDVPNQAPCVPDEMSHACLVWIGRRLDDTIDPGAPVGLAVASPDVVLYWVDCCKTGNVLRRNVVRPDLAAVVLSRNPMAGRRELLRCGPYRLYGAPEPATTR